MNPITWRTLRSWSLLASALTLTACGGEYATTEPSQTDTGVAQSITGPCPATIVIPGQNEAVGQYIQLKVQFPSSCGGVDAMIAYIDNQRCDQSPYAFPNAGCKVLSNQFSTSTWVEVAPGKHTLVVNSWQGSTVSVSAPVSFSYAGSTPTGVVISSPANGATVSSPVTVKATATASVPINNVQVWDNGNKLGAYPGTTVDQSYPLAAGSHTMTVESVDSSNAVINKSVITFTVTGSTGGTDAGSGGGADAGSGGGNGFGHDPVVVGAGDIGWYYGTSYEVATGNEIKAINPDLVFTLGDNAYGANNTDQGAMSSYSTCYDPAWGSFKSKTLPVPGNHDYGNWDSQTAGQQRIISGYYTYFTGGDSSSPSKAITVGGSTWNTLHYGYDIYTASGKKWRYIAVNSGDCFYAPYDTQNCGTSSSEYAWLKNELATHLKTISGGSYVGIIVGTHFNRWTSAGCGGGSGNVEPFVELMHDYHVDLYLAGHIHNYERFCQIGKYPGATSQGNCSVTTGPVCDPAGPVEVNVGTGGADDGKNANPDPWNASQKRLSQTGVVKLVLHDSSWDFEFRSTSNTVLDSATYQTH